jgi:ABC-type uncharacterized transport system involved in gliding motility auxiliary subunit
MKTKGLETYFYSTVGVAAMFLLVIAVNVIFARAKVRVDLTSERAYTLSQGTRNILSKLDTPVQIRFYCTRSENRMPVQLKTYAERIEDLLNEYRQASKGQIEIQKLDPQPDTDAEDSAKLDGVEGEALPDGEKIYLGMSITMLDQKEVLAFLSPDRERLLEYDLSRAISRVMTPEKPVVGIFSPLPLAGQQSNPMMMQMGRRGQPAWAFYNELKRDYNVKNVEVTADKIPDDVKVLVVIQPKAISDTAEYAIDQFVLRGGKLIAFVDPLAALDAASPNPMMGGGPSSSSLDKLFKAWGISFDTTKVVADMTYVARTRQGRAPGVLALTAQAMNKDDIVTADTDNLVMVFAGHFTGTPIQGLKENVLIKSSKVSELVEPMSAEMGGEQIIKDFKPSDTEYALAIRLTGKFKTAFPDGKPKAADAASPDKKPEEKKDDSSLKESTVDSAVILVGDTDMLQDQVAVQELQNPFGGQRMVMPSNGNLAFAQGAIEQLSGDSNLISIRSRASRERPFTVVKKMQADAEAAFQGKQKELEATAQEVNQKLNELQRAKPENGQRIILSPEQKQQLVEYNKKRAENDKQKRQLAKQLKSAVDSLETRTTWWNIAGMPALVTVVGIALAVNRRKKQAAR